MARQMKHDQPKVDKNGFGKHLATILKKMCSCVKADYNEIDFKSSDWFRQHKWSQKQEKLFQNWLAEYLFKNREARKELLEFGTYSNKTRCRRAAEEFTFMYGWSLSD